MSTDSDKQDINRLNWVLTMFLALFSFPVHELGHSVPLSLFGIPATFVIEIRTIGPILGIEIPYLPTTIPEIIFVIAAGGGFAAIVFGIAGYFWRTECYVIAILQACYVPFELVTWMLGIQAGGELSWFGWLFIMVLIPFVIISDKVLDRIENPTKEAEDQ